ncbi:MAG: DUF839 domain-containing protein [Pseudoxanthomonas sp.]
MVPRARQRPTRPARAIPSWCETRTACWICPQGFSYRVLERAGERMDDGYRVPGRPDAMGCFDLGNGHWALMRNHELDASALSERLSASA